MIPGLKSIKQNLARKRVRPDPPTTPKKNSLKHLFKASPGAARTLHGSNHGPSTTSTTQTPTSLSFPPIPTQQHETQANELHADYQALEDDTFLETTPTIGGGVDSGDSSSEESEPGDEDGIDVRYHLVRVPFLYQCTLQTQGISEALYEMCKVP